jgi:hypothetical protein
MAPITIALLVIQQQQASLQGSSVPAFICGLKIETRRQAVTAAAKRREIGPLPDLDQVLNTTGGFLAVMGAS